jgi:hypothetical protein
MAATKYDWMLRRWAEQNGILEKHPKPEPAELTPADPVEQSLGQGATEPAVPQEPDDTEQISEMVGVVKPWEKVDLYLDNWEYRVWEGWMGGKGKMADKQADILQDVLHQFDNNATVTKGPSKSDPRALTYSFKFSLGGDPDGVVDAITKINEAFLALDNYKVISGKMYAIVYYADGQETTMDLTPQLRDARGQPKGVDINDAVEMALDAITKGHAPESQWQRPTACPECGEKLSPSNEGIAQHYTEYHPTADVGKVFQEEIAKLEEEIHRQARPTTGVEHVAERMGGPEAWTPEPVTEPKEESMQFCQKCGAVLGPDERGWSVCMRCVDDINQGKPPGTWQGEGQTLAKKEGMPDLSYRSSPMGVSSTKADEASAADKKQWIETMRELPGAQTTEFDVAGRPKYPKWEDEALDTAGKILNEIEDIVSEHDFYVRIRNMLVDLANVIDMINEPTSPDSIRGHPTPSEPVQPVPEPQFGPDTKILGIKEPSPHLQTQPVGPTDALNKQEAVANPSGGQPHSYVMGKMGQCAICGLPPTHYAHYGH